MGVQTTTYVAGVPLCRLSTSYPHVTQLALQATAAFRNGSLVELQKLQCLMRSYQGPITTLGFGAGHFASLKNAELFEKERKKIMRTAGLQAQKTSLHYQFFTGEKNVRHSY